MGSSSAISPFPSRGSSSDVRQDPVHQQRHHAGAEQPGHGHSHKPGQEDVAEQAPVHGFLGADPAHGNHGANLGSVGKRQGDRG